jgi:hypothetical protein
MNVARQLVLALGLAAIPVSALAASNQTTPNATNADVIALDEHWDGIWNPVGGLVFDPTKAVPGKMPEELRDDPPYNPEWEAKYEKIIERHKKGFGDDPLGYCVPHGWPRLFGGAPGPLEIIIKPGTIYIIWEYMNQIRRIYTDGRGHPPAEQLYPSHFGHSIGHWEGKTLVVDTVSMMGYMPFDRTGAPHSDKVHTVERIRMIDKNTLENQITVTDPVAFTKPWVVTRQWRRAPANYAMQDVYCDLQRNPIENGQTQVLLPGDPGYDEARKESPLGHE